MNNEDDGRAEHHINQYIIKDEIGRGSFGAVHLAVDQYGKEYVGEHLEERLLVKESRADSIAGNQGIFQIPSAEAGAVQYTSKAPYGSTARSPSGRCRFQFSPAPTLRL